MKKEVSRSEGRRADTLAAEKTRVGKTRFEFSN